MWEYRALIVSLICIFFAGGCAQATDGDKNGPREKGDGHSMPLSVASTAFKEGEMVPAKYTCDGEELSPPLTFDAVPPDAKSIVVIADDPDAPGKTWVHWVMFNIPADERMIAQDVPKTENTPFDAVQGKNDFGKVGYGGPCPPSGTHRYFFKVYALDKELDLDSKATKADVEKAMEGHVTASGQLMGKYSRE